MSPHFSLIHSVTKHLFRPISVSLYLSTTLVSSLSCALSLPLSLSIYVYFLLVCFLCYSHSPFVTYSDTHHTSIPTTLIFFVKSLYPYPFPFLNMIESAILTQLPRSPPVTSPFATALISQAVVNNCMFSRRRKCKIR